MKIPEPIRKKSHTHPTVPTNLHPSLRSLRKLCVQSRRQHLIELHAMDTQHTRRVVMTLSLHPDVVAALRQYPGQAGRLVDEAIAARLGLQLRGAPPPAQAVAQAVAPQTQAAAVVPAAKAKTIEQQLDEYVSDPNGHPLSLIAAKAMLRSGQGLPKGARLIRKTAIDEVDIDRLVQEQMRAIEEGDTEF